MARKKKEQWTQEELDRAAEQAGKTIRELGWDKVAVVCCRGAAVGNQRFRQGLTYRLDSALAEELIVLGVAHREGEDPPVKPVAKAGATKVMLSQREAYVAMRQASPASSTPKPVGLNQREAYLAMRAKESKAPTAPMPGQFARYQAYRREHQTPATPRGLSQFESYQAMRAGEVKNNG